MPGRVQCHLPGIFAFYCIGTSATLHECEPIAPALGNRMWVIGPLAKRLFYP